MARGKTLTVTTPPASDDGEYEALEQLAGAAKDTLGRQWDNLDVIRQKADQSTTLALALIGGWFAMVVLGIETIHTVMTPLFVALVVGGLVAAFLALASFVTSTLATRTQLLIGPEVGWLAQKADQPAFSKMDYWSSFVLSAAGSKDEPGWVDKNTARMENAISHRLVGIGILVVSVLLFTLASIYVLVKAY